MGKVTGWTWVDIDGNPQKPAEIWQGNPSPESVKLASKKGLYPAFLRMDDTAKDNAVQQAQQWAQEARTQQLIVKEIGELVGCSNDWEMVSAVKAALASKTEINQRSIRNAVVGMDGSGEGGTQGVQIVNSIDSESVLSSAMDDPTGKHEMILLVQDPTPNFQPATQQGEQEPEFHKARDNSRDCYFAERHESLNTLRGRVIYERAFESGANWAIENRCAAPQPAVVPEKLRQIYRELIQAHNRHYPSHVENPSAYARVVASILQQCYIDEENDCDRDPLSLIAAAPEQPAGEG